jgi:hypothetical protein
MGIDELWEQSGKDQDAFRVEHAREDSLLQNTSRRSRIDRTLSQRATVFAQQGADAQIHEVDRSYVADDVKGKGR